MNLQKALQERMLSEEYRPFYPDFYEKLERKEWRRKQIEIAEKFKTNVNQELRFWPHRLWPILTIGGLREINPLGAPYAS